jgi:hypothetical protein
MITPTDCPIWGTPANLISSEWSEMREYYSPRAGGRFKIHRNTIDDNPIKSTEQRVSISLWISERNSLSNDIPLITDDNFGYISSYGRLNTSLMRDRFLSFFKSIRPGQTVTFNEDVSVFDINDEFHTNLLLASIGADSFREGAALLDLMYEDGIVVHKASHIRFTSKGYSAIDVIVENIDSHKVFVAMWFDKSMEDAWRIGIKPAIQDCGYIPVRIDKVEQNGKIDDAIISEIRKSRFLVADFTCPVSQIDDVPKYEPRGGVYYEAGFAHGLGVEVIFTCRSDMIKSLHFDTRQFAHILWSDPQELRRQLCNRIGATVGDAPGAPGFGRSPVDPPTDAPS